jgi:hypothetical protein
MKLTRGEKLLSILVIILLLALLLNKCEKDARVNISDPTTPIKDTIKILQTKVVVLDSIRTKFVYKWRTTKDTINLRDTIEVLKLLSVCDTVILTDSVEIATLKNINFQYVKILKIDSVKIDSLTKSKRKFWKGFQSGFVAGSILTGSIIWTTAIK